MKSKVNNFRSDAISSKRPIKNADDNSYLEAEQQNLNDLTPYVLVVTFGISRRVKVLLRKFIVVVLTSDLNVKK